MPKRAEQAARRFFALIAPGESWHYTNHPSKRLVVAAFELYARAWSPFDIRQWEWPFTTLERREPFAGNEPWTILLDHAVRLAKPSRHKRKAA